VNQSDVKKSRLIALLQAGCAVGLMALFLLPAPIGLPHRILAITLLAGLILLNFSRTRAMPEPAQASGGLHELLSESGGVGQSLLDGVSDPAIIVDNKFGISVINKAARKALEMDEDQCELCFRAIHGLDAPCDESGQPCVIKTGQSWKTIQTRRGDDGEEQLVELRATPLFDDAGEVIGAVEVLHDLNEQEKLALKLQRAKEDAETANKARTDFVATVSHEVRTPMNAVLGMADLLRLTALTRKQKSYVQVMESSSNMLLSLVDNMIDFATLESGSLELHSDTFRVGDLLERVIEIMGYPAYSKGLELAGTVEGDAELQVVGDFERLRQIMINLVSNAIKYTEEGEVIVNIGVDDANGVTALSVSVADSGIGMSEKAAAKLFKPFESVADTQAGQEKGSGLGLTISKQLVDLMGGRISLQSEPGSGTSVWFSVPVSTAEVQSPFADSDSSLSNRRLLIVNDNPKVSAAMASCLDAWNISCDVESRPERVTGRMLAATESGYPYDCVIIDAEVRKTDRLALARELRDESRVPVILLASIARPLKVGETSSIGNARCVNKPILPSELRHNLFQLLNVDVADPMRSESGLSSSMRILIAEDNPLNRNVLRVMLKSLDIKVDTVEDGPSVLSALQDNRYDLILMDCQMPGMDGDEVTKVIREGRGEGMGQPVVVAVTADVSAYHRDQCLRAGMDDFLPKPIRLDTLKAGLRRWSNMSYSRRVQLPDATASRAPAQDVELVGRLQDRTGDVGDEFVGEFIDLFLDDTASRIEILRVALDKQDLETLRRECHALKGACLELGVADLGTCCDDLGKASREKRFDELPGALHRLAAEFDRVRPIFEAEKSRPN
jgi:signal transduction histidine kinase/CheY-like chemotaxis protein